MALRPRVANELAPRTGFTFATIALGGTTPRTWYYALRAVDPVGRNYAAIVIPSDDYNEPDSYDDQSDRELDLHYIINRLNLFDLVDFPWSYSSNALKWVACRDILLKGSVYKFDFLDFLAHPLNRVAKVYGYGRELMARQYTYSGTEESLSGLRIDWQRRVMDFPDRLPPDERNRIREVLFSSRPPDRGKQTAYLHYWYGRIVNMYRGTGTKVFFLRVPRAPVSPPEEPTKFNSAVRRLATNPEVTVLDEHLFDQLERPEFFADGLHLNREGMERFSRILALEIQGHLGRPVF